MRRGVTVRGESRRTESGLRSKDKVSGETLPSQPCSRRPPRHFGRDIKACRSMGKGVGGWAVARHPSWCRRVPDRAMCGTSVSKAPSPNTCNTHHTTPSPRSGFHDHLRVSCTLNHPRRPAPVPTPDAPGHPPAKRNNPTDRRASARFRKREHCPSCMPACSTLGPGSSPHPVYKL